MADKSLGLAGVAGNMPVEMTRGQRTRADITAFLKARNTFLWVTSQEKEMLVEGALIEACAANAMRTLFWDCRRGITEFDGSPGGRVLANADEAGDPAAALDWLKKATGRVVLVMRDLHPYLREGGYPGLVRAVRNAHAEMQVAIRPEARAVIVLTPSSEIPPDLRGTATVIDWPLPDRAEITATLRSTLDSLNEKEVLAKSLSGAAFEAAVDAAVGLTVAEAENCFSLSLVTLKTVNAGRVAQEKKQIIKRVPGLTWYDADPRGLDAIAGLDLLKPWLVSCGMAYSPAARAYGLPTPRGAFLTGLPGTGKSLTAKALAAAWGVPLIRWDVGAMRSKYVGDSEQNMRRVLQIVESLGRCVLWLDEIEKMVAGSSGPQGDGGVAADMLGALLSWMQERTCEAFIFATSNDVQSLPPELLRKGRFDEVWWVDLPTKREREAILQTTLRKYKREDGIDVSVVAEITEGFVGAEFDAIVRAAMNVGFADGARPITAADLVTVAREIVPLSKTAKKKIDGLREWAKGAARPASSPETASNGAGRAIDL